MTGEKPVETSKTWVCGKCGSPLQTQPINVSYLGSGYPVDLLVCPKCKRALVPADMALGKMQEVEKLLEDK